MLQRTDAAEAIVGQCVASITGADVRTTRVSTSVFTGVSSAVTFVIFCK